MWSFLCVLKGSSASPFPIVAPLIHYESPRIKSLLVIKSACRSSKNSPTAGDRLLITLLEYTNLVPPNSRCRCQNSIAGHQMVWGLWLCDSAAEGNQLEVNKSKKIYFLPSERLCNYPLGPFASTSPTSLSGTVSPCTSKFLIVLLQ